MPFLYRISRDGSALRRWELGDMPLVVGRDVSANASINDEYLSESHFEIRRKGRLWMIRDLGSKNGTWLNGKRVLLQELALNDRIVAGHTLFLIEAGLGTMIRQLEHDEMTAMSHCCEMAVRSRGYHGAFPNETFPPESEKCPE